MSFEDPPTNSCTRRRILGWTGGGALGGLACYFGWPKSAIKPAPTGETKLPAAPRASSDSPELPAEHAGQPSPAGTLRREDFLQHLKSVFQLDSKQNCTLVDVSTAQKIASPTAEFTSFSLLFTAPVDFISDSRIYQLSHGKMETMDLFLSPVGQSKGQVYLEAVCSQKV